MFMKSVGIIGSFGPTTTAHFFEELLTRMEKINKQFRPKIILFSTPIPLKEEENLILFGQKPETIKKLILEAAVNLEKMGVDFLVLPCNTLHIFISDIQRAIKIPILDVTKLAVDTLMTNNISNVGLLSTSATINNQLFRNNKIKITQLSKKSQLKLDQIICDVVRGKNLGNTILNPFITELKNSGAQAVLLACTDLQLIPFNSKNIPIFDTFQILLNKTVQTLL